MSTKAWVGQVKQLAVLVHEGQGIGLDLLLGLAMLLTVFI